MTSNNFFFRVVKKLKAIKFFTSHPNEQAGLVLIASIPGFILSLVALRWAGASYYLIAFIGIILLLLISYATFMGKNRANYQIQTLSNLVEAMIDGDYTLRGRRQNNPAFQELLDLINQLANSLHQHKLKAEESQLLLEKIMQQMGAMLFATDSSGKIAIINSAAKKIFFPQDNHNLIQSVNEAPAFDKSGINQLLQQEQSGIIRLEHKNISGEFFLFRDQFYSNNQIHQLYLLTKADKVLREKEREAWQNLLRVLSHELNNSLTPIATFSNTMLRKINKENQVTDLNRFKEGLSVIKERAESLNQFIISYSQLSHLPKANKKNYYWRDKLSQLTRLFNDCQFDNRLINNDKLDFMIQADPQQLEQVFINLFKNAREAMMDIDNKLIEIDAEHTETSLIISISDNGSGIANPNNLFVPFYTTKESGSGIGLTLCQQILSNHNGSLSLTNRMNTKGAVAKIILPAFQ